MELELSPLANEQVQFGDRVVRLEARDPVALVGAALRRTDEFLVMCGWCKRIPLPDSRRVEVEEAVRVLKLFSLAAMTRLSHSICLECSKRFEEPVE